MKWFNKRVLLIFSSANILTQIIIILSEFVILRLIDPDKIGLWQALLLIQGYAVISRFGILNAFNREYPFFVGLGDKKNAQDILSTTAFFIFINAIVALFLIISIGITVKTDFLWRIAIIVAAFQFLIESIVNFYESLYRSNRQFTKISKIKLAIIPVVIATLLLPYNYDFYGLLIRVLIISGFKLFILYYYNSIPISFLFNKKKFWFLFHNGWKLWLWSYLKNFSKSLPRLVLLSFSGSILLGLYAPVNWMNMAFINFSGSITAYLYPNLSIELAQGSTNIGKQSLKISLYTFLFFLPVAIVGVTCIPFVIPFLLPNYSEAIVAMQIALVSGLIDIFLISTTALASIKHWNYMYSHLAWMIIIRAICVIGGYYIFTNSLNGVALGMLVSSIILSIITYLYVRKI